MVEKEKSDIFFWNDWWQSKNIDAEQSASVSKADASRKAMWRKTLAICLIVNGKLVNSIYFHLLD